MTETIITSFTAYVSTNFDDILILMLLFAKPNANFFKIFVGKLLGIGFLTAISLLGACGLQVIPQEYVRFLGFIPILLGAKVFWVYHKKNENPQNINTSKAVILDTAIITVANGADNIGIYIPLFVGYTLTQGIITVAIFIIMTLFWCLLGNQIARISLLRRAIHKYSQIITPLIYVLLGIYILLF